MLSLQNRSFLFCYISDISPFFCIFVCLIVYLSVYLYCFAHMDSLSWFIISIYVLKRLVELPNDPLHDSGSPQGRGATYPCAVWLENPGDSLGAGNQANCSHLFHPVSIITYRVKCVFWSSISDILELTTMANKYRRQLFSFMSRIEKYNRALNRRGGHK